MRFLLLAILAIGSFSAMGQEISDPDYTFDSELKIYYKQKKINIDGSVTIKRPAMSDGDELLPIFEESGQKVGKGVCHALGYKKLVSYNTTIIKPVYWFGQNGHQVHKSHKGAVIERDGDFGGFINVKPFSQDDLARVEEITCKNKKL